MGERREREIKESYQRVKKRERERVSALSLVTGTSVALSR
jgi:hypothetical protein